jgi:hypothetical protein
VLDEVPFDETRYLDPEIMALGNTIMGEFEPQEPVLEDRPYLEEYMHLREQLRLHRNRRLEPRLCIPKKPTGGSSRLKEVLLEKSIDVDELFVGLGDQEDGFPEEDIDLDDETPPEGGLLFDH